jgi:hypothetical protein
MLARSIHAPDIDIDRHEGIRGLIFESSIFLMDYTSILYVRQYRMVRGTLHEDIY